MTDYWIAAEALSRTALAEVEAQRDFVHAEIEATRARGVSEGWIHWMCFFYHRAEERQRDAMIMAIEGRELPLVAEHVYKRWRHVARAAIGMQDDPEPDEPDDEDEDASEGPWHDAAVSTLAALAAEHGMDELCRVIAAGLSEEEKADLLGGQAVTLTGPRGEGFPADSWAARPESAAPGIAENSPVPSRPPRSKGVRRRRAKAEMRARRRAAKARRA